MSPGKMQVCALGFCVSQCNASVDCASGQLCFTSDVGNACRAPETAAKGCVRNSDCTKLCAATATVCPIVCGRDLTCRTQCAQDIDCPGGDRPGGQFCTPSGACADPILDKALLDPDTMDFKTPTAGTAGTHGAAGATGSAGTTGVAGTNGGGGTTGQAGADGGTTGAAGTNADGGTDTVTGAAGTTAAIDAGNKDAAFVPMGGTVTVTPGAQVRQGQQGQQSATITITALRGLSNASVIDFAGLTGRVQAESSDTSLVIKVSVPHGAPLGKKTLKVSTAGGTITETDIVEVTAITAGPTGVDTNAGTPLAPFRTLKTAIGVADTGDSIHLMDGTYKQSSGEMWPYTIPSNVTIYGDSTAATIVDGVGATTSPNGIDAPLVLTLKTITFQHFQSGIDIKAPASNITLTDVNLNGNSYYGIYVESTAPGSTVSISGANGMIDQPAHVGIGINSAASTTLTIKDGTIQAGANVIDVSGASNGTKINVSNATLKQLANYSAFSIGATSTPGTIVTMDKATITGTVNDTDDKGSLTITNSTIAQKSGVGVNFSGTTLSMTSTSITMMDNNSGINWSGNTTGVQPSMTLNKVTIKGGSYGVYQSAAGGAAKLRGTSITGTTYHSYYLYAGDLDLGTMTESGSNQLGTPTGGINYYYALAITRAAGQNSGGPVTSSDTGFGDSGLVPSPGTIDASGAVQTLAPSRYYVAVGNKLIFY